MALRHWDKNRFQVHFLSEIVWMKVTLDALANVIIWQPIIWMVIFWEFYLLHRQFPKLDLQKSCLDTFWVHFSLFMIEKVFQSSLLS